MNYFSLSLLNGLNDRILPLNCLINFIDEYRNGYDIEKDPFLSPLHMTEKVLKYLPPIRIIFGSLDPLRDQIIYFIKKICDINKDLKIIELKYFPHGFLNYDKKSLFKEAKIGTKIFMDEIEPFLKTS